MATKAKKKAAKKAAPKKAAAKKTVAKPKAAKAPEVAPNRRIARQPSLPTMEDREMSALEEKAIEYKEVQSERQACLSREVELKKDIMAMMRTAKKKTYSHNGINIEIVPENEKVKVKVDKKAAAGDEEEEQEASGSATVDNIEDEPDGSEDDEGEESEVFEDDEEDDTPPFGDEATN